MKSTETKSKIIKVAVIERDCRRRAKLAAAIDCTPGFACVGGYAVLDETAHDFADALPDIVLCSFHFADCSERQVVRILRKRHRHLPILILNLYDVDENVFDADEFAAGGYLLKLTLPAELLENPLAVGGGGDRSFLGSIAANLRGSFKNRLAAEAADYALTPHEVRLLKLLIDGHNHTTSAKILNVSYNTVKFHMRRIYQKLEVHSKSAAVAKAMRYRLTE